MNLLDLRIEVVDAARAHFAAQPTLKIEPHGGRFNIVELDSYALSAPEIRVAILSGRWAPKGRNLFDADMAAYVIAGRDRYMLASERGLVLSSAFLRFVHIYSPADGRESDTVGFQNLYSADTRERNKHLCGITWTQRFELTDDQAASLDDFLLAAVTYDLAPADERPEANDDISLPPPV